MHYCKDEGSIKRKMNILRSHLSYYDRKLKKMEGIPHKKKAHGKRQVSDKQFMESATGILFTKENYNFLSKVKGDLSFASVINNLVDNYRSTYNLCNHTISLSDCCVVCGCYVPEGTHICENCASGISSIKKGILSVP